MKKALLTAAVLASTTAGGLATASVVSAATDTSQSPESSLVDKVASKFGLNKADVQKVFDEDRAARQTERETKAKEALAQAVTDGKLTQAQADKITAKRAEMKTFMESLRDKTASERRAAMEAKRDELQQWAKDNGIDESYLRPMAGRGHGPGGPGGIKSDDSSSVTTQ